MVYLEDWPVKSCFASKVGQLNLGFACKVSQLNLGFAWKVGQLNHGLPGRLAS